MASSGVVTTGLWPTERDGLAVPWFSRAERGTFIAPEASHPTPTFLYLIIPFRPSIMFDRQVFFRLLSRPFSSLSLAIGLAICAQTQLPAENWTSLVGNRTIQAQMVGLWDDNVILLMSNGRKVSVPMKSLVAESRIQAEEIAERLKSQRQALSDELRQVASAESAPAPDPLPTPPAAPAYTPLAAGLSADEAVSQIQQQLRDGHLAVIFDALPPSYRSDLDQLVDLAMQKVDPNEWNQGYQQLYRLADLLVTRQNWILSHPRLSSGDPNSPSAYGEAFDELFLPLANMIRVGMADNAFSPESIRGQGFTAWFRERSSVMAPYLHQLTGSFTSSEARWEVGSFKEDSAMIQPVGSGATQPGQRRGNRGGSIEIVKVDGYWVPKIVSERFPDWIKEQTEKLNGMTDGEATMASIFADAAGPMVAGMATQAPQMLDSFLAPLESANSATAFHEASEQTIAAIQPMFSMVSAFAKMGASRGGNGMGGYGNSGYDDMNMGMGPPDYGEPMMMEDGSMDQSGPGYGMQPTNQ